MSRMRHIETTMLLVISGVRHYFASVWLNIDCEWTHDGRMRAVLSRICRLTVLGSKVAKGGPVRRVSPARYSGFACLSFYGVI